MPSDEAKTARFRRWCIGLQILTLISLISITQDLKALYARDAQRPPPPLAPTARDIAAEVQQLFAGPVFQVEHAGHSTNDARLTRVEFRLKVRTDLISDLTVSASDGITAKLKETHKDSAFTLYSAEFRKDSIPSRWSFTLEAQTPFSNVHRTYTVAQNSTASDTLAFTLE